MQEFTKQGGRVRFAGSGQEETASSSKGGKLPPQKSTSFKGARKWFQRQFSGQLSSNEEQAAAIAAATYAINNLELDDRRSPRQDLETTPPSLVRRKSKIEESGSISDSARRLSKRFTERFLKLKSEEEEDDDFQPPIGSSQVLEDKKMRPNPPMKKKSSLKSFKDKKQLQEEEIGPENADDVPPEPVMLSPKQPPPPPPPPPPPLRPRTWTFPRKDKGKHRTDVGKERESSGGMQKTENEAADAWEQAELARIKEKYDTLNGTILEWEDNKKKKATRRLHKIESEMEKKRAKAMTSYKEDMERIKQIADGAKTQSRDKQRIEELKAKEKANKFRTTGEPPAKCCPCF